MLVSRSANISATTHPYPKLMTYIYNGQGVGSKENIQVPVKMAAKVSLSSLSTQIPVLPKSSSLPHLTNAISSPKTRVHHFKIHASLGEGDGELKPKGKKKFITREQEPEQYWQSAGEREGENPMKTPIPYIIIFGMSTPFVILAIAFANGWIKVPVR